MSEVFLRKLNKIRNARKKFWEKIELNRYRNFQGICNF
jgi:hypothetical protein